MIINANISVVWENYNKKHFKYLVQHEISFYQIKPSP